LPSKPNFCSSRPDFELIYSAPQPPPGILKLRNAWVRRLPGRAESLAPSFGNIMSCPNSAETKQSKASVLETKAVGLILEDEDLEYAMKAFNETEKEE